MDPSIGLPHPVLASSPGLEVWIWEGIVYLASREQAEEMADRLQKAARDQKPGQAATGEAVE